MAENINIGTIWDSLREDITELINTRLQLLRLEVYEKTCKISSTLVFGVIAIHLVFFTLLFGFIALGFLFGGWLNSLVAGFGLVMGVNLILFAVLFLLRKKILRWVENGVLKQLYPDQDTEADCARPKGGES